MTDIDWTALASRAIHIARRAYAPYSGLHVGAAGLTSDGAVVVGCNVENASYGLTLCAENGLVSALRAEDHHGLVAVAVRTGEGRPVMPCGGCRQLLWEAGGPELLVDGDGTPRPMRELLPGAFEAHDLPER